MKQFILCLILLISNKIVLDGPFESYKIKQQIESSVLAGNSKGPQDQLNKLQKFTSCRINYSGSEDITPLSSNTVA